MRSVLAVTLAAAMCPLAPALDKIEGSSSEAFAQDASDVSAETWGNWAEWGTCEWAIGDKGTLVVRPANGSSEGIVPGGDAPWKDDEALIKSVKSLRFEKKCKVGKVAKEGRETASCYKWFEGFTALEKADLSGLDTSNVTDMSWMFHNCSSLKTLDLSGVDTSRVTYMGAMLFNCSALEELDLSGFDTSGATHMDMMFCNCSALKSLDFSGFDTSKVTNMGLMFFGCSSLTSIDLSGFDTSKVTSVEGMFGDCSALASVGDLSGWDTSSATKLADMFYGCSSLESVGDLSGWDVSGVTSLGGMFCECSSLASVGDLSGWDTSNVTKLHGMFYDCSALVSVGDLSSWDVSSATELISLFERCSSLESVGDLSGWDVSSATNLSAMFCNCSSLSSVGDLSGWNTSQVTAMESIFFGCSSLKSLDLSGWDTSNVTSLTYRPTDSETGEALGAAEGAFGGCSSLTSLNLSGWDTSKVADMAEMFDGCSSLRTVVLGDAFTFCGSGGERMCSLPAPSGDGLTGKWASSADGKTYSPEETPNNVAATYIAECHFPDVDYSADSWYADGVAFCAAKGLITGYASGDDAGKFGVGRTLTRAELAVILWRNADPEAAATYDGDAANATGMTDVADNQWYTGAANWAVKNEVINGFDGVEFRPDAAVTAEQLVTILANYADRAGAEDADLGVLSGFADSDAIFDWARGSVAWAKARGIINGYDEGGVRFLKPYEEIARERAATILMNAFESGVLK